MKIQNSTEMIDWLYGAVGERVKIARTTKAKLTQMQVAKLVGLNRTSIAKIESGGQRFTLDTLYLLASALSVPLGSLLPKLEKNLQGSNNDKSILKLGSSPEGLHKDEMQSILNSITEARSK